MVKPLACPPLRVYACSMTGILITATHTLADAVGRHEEPLWVDGSSSEESLMFGKLSDVEGSVLAKPLIHTTTHACFIDGLHKLKHLVQTSGIGVDMDGVRLLQRSEERRVGKEGQAGGRPARHTTG